MNKKEYESLQVSIQTLDDKIKELKSIITFVKADGFEGYAYVHKIVRKESTIILQSIVGIEVEREISLSPEFRNIIVTIAEKEISELKSIKEELINNLSYKHTNNPCTEDSGE